MQDQHQCKSEATTCNCNSHHYRQNQNQKSMLCVCNKTKGPNASHIDCSIVLFYISQYTQSIGRKQLTICILSSYEYPQVPVDYMQLLGQLFYLSLSTSLASTCEALYTAYWIVNSHFFSTLCCQSFSTSCSKMDH